MGCSASKPGPNGEAETGFGPGISPIRRKIGEIKRRNRMKSGTLSTKELLNSGEAEEGVSPTDSKRLPESYDDIENDESKDRKPELKEHEKTSGIADEKANSGMSSDERKVPGGEKEIKASEVSSYEKNDDEMTDDAAEKGEEEEVVELGFGDVPSSPSFREYFISARENGGSGKVRERKEAEGKDTGMIQRRRDSSGSQEELEGKTATKVRGLRVFKRGTGAMYKSLSIKSCYKPTTTDSPSYSSKQV